MQGKDWHLIIQPLLEKYKGRKHPLEYKNLYQLLVMVVLSAQDADANINRMSEQFFATFPSLEILAVADKSAILSVITSVRNSQKKADRLHAIARTLKSDRNIPLTMEGLVKLYGIGRKSANVILRESGRPAEGIMVDIHVVRVAPRIGLVQASEQNEIEAELMQLFPKVDWDIGMALSFLGREICRPTKPNCAICPLIADCKYAMYFDGK